MKNNVLSRRNVIIVVLLALICVLCITGLLIKIFVKPPLHTVLRYDKDGDLLYARITNSEVTLSSLTQYLESGEKNDYYVKKGEADDVWFTFRAKQADISYQPFIIPEVSDEKFQSVEISNSFGTYTLNKGKNGTYYLADAPKISLNMQSTAQIAIQAKYMLALQKLENPSKNLSDYGLDKSDSPITLKLTDTDGNVNVVYFGDMSAAANGYYAKHKDKPYIYVVDASASVLGNPASALVSTALEQPLEESEYSYMETFSIKKNGEDFIKCEINSQSTEGQTNLHKITYPAPYTPSLTAFYEALGALSSPAGATVAEYNISAKHNKEELFDFYGLTVPSNEVSYSAGNKKCSFITGNSITLDDGEKYLYAYSLYSDCIMTLPVKAMPFLEYSLIDFINPNIFRYNIENVTAVKVKTQSAECEFALSKNGTQLTVKDKISGKVIDAPSFRQFYVSLLNVTVDNHSSSVDTEPLTHDLTFTVKTKFDTEFTYSFYTLSTLRCLAVTNSGTAFYETNRAYVDKIIENTQKLLNGIEITPDY